MALSVSGSPFARRLLLAYGLLNALLYSSLLPLWEGFDEPFHFSYVQSLAEGRGTPDPRSSRLSREIGASLLLVPGSAEVQQNLPAIRTYQEYFKLPQSQRMAMRQQLGLLRGTGGGDGQILNYEGQQAPGAYVLLAVPERILTGLPLSDRVLALRILGAFCATILLCFGAARLFDELQLHEPWKSAAIFCLLSTQMLWATVAHVANDWLALPLAVWLLVITIRCWRRPGVKVAACFGCLLAAGLLTKAYFLALVPLGGVFIVTKGRLREFWIAAAIVMGAAGPWYVRNVLRYGSVTGMQESRVGIGVMSVIGSAGKLNWPAVIVAGARSSLWTGNNSFTAFSGSTEAVVITACAIALVLWMRGRHNAAEAITVVFCCLFLAALGYDSVVAFISSAGTARGPSPWYSQILLAPMLGLALLGCSRAAALGKAIAMVLVSVSAYMLTATYLFKLIPYYAGYAGRTTLRGLVIAYSDIGKLNEIALAPAWLLIGLAVTVSGMAFISAWMLSRSIFRAGLPATLIVDGGRSLDPAIGYAHGAHASPRGNAASSRGQAPRGRRPGAY